MKMHIATIPEGALKVKSRSAYYSSQKRLFSLVVILVSIAPLIVISFMSLHYYKKSWMKKTSKALLNLADSRKEMIELFLNNQENILAGLLELYPPEFLIKHGNLEKVFSAIGRSGVIVDLGVIDGSGTHRAYVGPYKNILSGRNYLNAEWYSETIRKGRFVSDVFKGYRNEPHIIIALTDTTRNWIFRATVNSEYFNALLATAEVGANGDAYIINRRGELQTQSRIEQSGVLPVSQENLRSGQGSYAFGDNRFIYATSPLKDGDWTLVLKTDIDTSLSEFYSVRNREFVYIALAAVLIVSVSRVLIGYLMDRVEEADHQRMNINNRMLEVEKMALVGRLASSVAHEINNPLQIIDDQAGWIEDLLADEGKNKMDTYRNSAAKIRDDEYRSCAAKIRAHVKRAKDITHKLLGFSRSGEGDCTEIDLNQLVAESVSFLEREVDRHRILIRKNLDDNLPEILTSAPQLQQVFINIINNAIDAIGQDGVITISTRSDGEGKVVAEFADSGPGMPEEVRQRLFEPLFSTKKSGNNAGLGLSISYNILQRLGGDIQARNGKQAGSVFVVTLPVSRRA